jgi:hypothetical protein
MFLHPECISFFGKLFPYISEIQLEYSEFREAVLHIWTFYLWLFSYVVRSSNYVASNDRINTEYLTGKNMEGSIGGLIQDCALPRILREGAEENYENPQDNRPQGGDIREHEL